MIPLVLQVALGQREKIMIFGDDYETRDGTCIRDYIHVSDLADAHLRGLKHLQLGSRKPRMPPGDRQRLHGQGDYRRRARGHGAPDPGRDRAQAGGGDPAMLVSGGSRAKDVLGWTPGRGDVRDVIRDAWRFLSENPNGYSRVWFHGGAGHPLARSGGPLLHHGLQGFDAAVFDQQLRVATFDAYVDTIETQFEGRESAGVSAALLRSRYRDAAVEASTPAAFYGVLRALLSDLDDPLTRA